jgi:hypothetical protein
MGKAAKGCRLVDKPLASKWLYVQDILIKVVCTAPGFVLRVLVIHSSDVANTDSKAAEVICLINLVKDELLV